MDVMVNLMSKKITKALMNQIVWLNMNIARHKVYSFENMSKSIIIASRVILNDMA